MNIKEPIIERWSVNYNHPEPAKAQIEKAMRVCYKSAAKQTSTSYERMYTLATTGGHLNCLEHGTYYITLTPKDSFDDFITINNILRSDEHVRMYHTQTNIGLGSTIAVVDGRTMYQLKESFKNIDLNVSQVIPAELFTSKELNIYGKERITIYMELDRSIADEFVRHRTLCPLMESSRYVKYKDDISFGLPLSGITHGENGHIEPFKFGKNSDAVKIITDLYKEAEEAYNKLLELNYAPQIARYVLPLGYATHLVMTGFMDDWERFCERRTASGAHPNARIIAQKIKDIIDNARNEINKQ